MHKIVVTVLFILVASGSCQGQGRIVGGSEVSIASYPYMAALFTSNLKFKCGATILNPHWVLTAAHCSLLNVDLETGNPIFFRPNELLVMIGSSEIPKIPDKSQMKNVASIVRHENYITENVFDDIMLIKVTEPITFGPGVNRIKLPKHGAGSVDPKEVGMCFALGWGLTPPMTSKEIDAIQLGDNVKGTDVLLEVGLALMSISNCKNKVTVQVDLQKTLCTTSEKGKSTCKGDSGGPLICKGEQWGIVRGGDACGYAEHPGVWIRVDAYLDWIQKVTGSSSGCQLDEPKYKAHTVAVVMIILLM